MYLRGTEREGGAAEDSASGMWARAARRRTDARRHGGVHAAVTVAAVGAVVSPLARGRDRATAAVVADAVEGVRAHVLTDQAVVLLVVVRRVRRHLELRIHAHAHARGARRAVGIPMVSV